MADELKDQRVVTMMSPTELASIDDWMFKNRIRSRGEAIRRLCQMGLNADERASQAYVHLNAASDTIIQNGELLDDAFDSILEEKNEFDLNKIFNLVEDLFGTFQKIHLAILYARSEAHGIKAIGNLLTDEKYSEIEIAKAGDALRSKVRSLLEKVKDIRFVPEGGTPPTKED